MRQFFILILLFLFNHSNSQCLVGTWDGSCITPDGKYQSKIIIVFELAADSSYTIKSYTEVKNENGKDTTIITKMNYKRKSNKILVLTEIEKEDFTLDKNVSCYQKMELKVIGFRRFCDELEGKWFCKNDKTTFGYIRLIKRQPKGIRWSS